VVLISQVTTFCYSIMSSFLAYGTAPGMSNVLVFKVVSNTKLKVEGWPTNVIGAGGKESLSKMVKIESAIAIGDDEEKLKDHCIMINGKRLGQTKQKKGLSSGNNDQILILILKISTGVRAWGSKPYIA
jgi:N-acyl-L-homoserine lactone synthetase